MLPSRSNDRDHINEQGASVVSSTHEQNSICSQKKLHAIAHEHTIICRQLFAGHVVGSRPMKGKKHLNRMIIVLFCRGGGAAIAPRWGRAVHTKTPWWSLKKCDKASPWEHIKFQMLYLQEISSKLIKTGEAPSANRS